MFSLRPVLIIASLALLVFPVPSASVVFAQQQDAENATLMTNYNALREEGQGFYLVAVSALDENPDSVTTPFVALDWLCDLEFASDDATNNYGYVGRAVGYFLGATLEDVVAQGGKRPSSKKDTLSISAVLVPDLGIFEGQFHNAYTDLVVRYWDDGSSTLPFLGWEGHGEGGTHPDTFTSSALSSVGTITKITTEEAAKFLGMDVADMTPTACHMEYEAAWNLTNVPNPIDTSVTASEEKFTQLEANVNELMSRFSGDDGDPMLTSSSPFMAWYKHDITDIVVKSIMTGVIIIGLVAVDFI